jgi:hypothetical protein
VASAQSIDNEAECQRIAALLEQVRRKDRQAFDELEPSIRRRAHGWIRSILGAVQPDDTYQKVLITLWTKTPEWQGCAPFVAWLKMVSRRAALDAIPVAPPGPIGPGAGGVQPVVDDSILADEMISLVLNDVARPHYTLCLITNKFLGEPPLLIVERRQMALLDWLDELQVRLPNETIIEDPDWWDSRLSALRQTMATDSGEQCMDDLGLPEDPQQAARMVAHWVGDVRRRVLKAVAVQYRKDRSISTSTAAVNKQ